MRIILDSIIVIFGEHPCEAYSDQWEAQLASNLVSDIEMSIWKCTGELYFRMNVNNRRDIK